MSQPAVAPTLISLEDALHMTKARSVELHQQHLNPRVAKLFAMIGADSPVVRAEGCRFWDADGVEYVDFLTGFASVSFGYNHPAIRRAMETINEVPTLLEGLNHLAAALAHNVVQLMPAGLQRVFFANSGAEVVDASIKLIRAASGRKKIASCVGSFHGRTIGALSLMTEKDFREPFEPLLADVVHVKYGDAAALEAALRKKEVAGFIVEPIQGEGGMVVPPDGYLRAVRNICSRYGTLMVADEVQTGLGRTGRMLAVNHEDVVPDVVLLGKALGGGVMPLSALVTTDDVFKAAKATERRSPLQTPTFGANARACAAGLAALEVLVGENMAEQAAASGAYLLDRLRDLANRYDVIANVRGKGLMIGIEFAPATQGLATWLTGGVLNKLSKQFMTGIVLMEMRKEHHVMMAYPLGDPNVLRVQPPLNITRDDIDYVLESLDKTLAKLKSFPQALFATWRNFLES